MTQTRYGWLDRRLARRKALAGGAATALGVGGLLAVGCGDDDDDGDTPSTPTSAPGTTPSAAAASPKTDGTLRIHMPVDPPHLDMHRNAAHQIYQTIGLSYNQLFTFATGPGASPYPEELEGELVEKWEQPDSDKLTYNLTLRGGVKWHNVDPTNGRELTAEDVAYSFERMTDASQPETAFLTRLWTPLIDSVRAVDARTVQIKAKRPYAPMLAMLAHLNAYIVPREAVEKWGDLKEHSVGTGPFMLRELARGNAYRYDRNPDYFLTGKPYVDKLEYLVVPDPALQISSLRSGQLTLAGVSAQQNKDLADADFTKQTVEGYTGSLVSITRSKEELKDARVRKAISLAMSRDAIIQAVVQGEARKYVMLPGVMKRWQLPESELEAAFTPNIADAKKLMEAAGRGGGMEMTWEVAGQQQPAALATMEVLQQQLREINITLKIANVEYATWQKHLVERSMLATVSGNRPYQDPDIYSYVSYHPDSASPGNGSDDPAFNELAEKQRVAFDEGERLKLVHDLQRRMLEIQLQIDVYDPNLFFVAQKSVRDYVPSEVTGQRNLAHVWLDT